MPRVTSDEQQATELLAGVVGHDLQQLRVGVGQVQLVFDDGKFVHLAGRTRLDEGPEIEEPQSLEGLAILLPFLNESVVSAEVGPGGTLAVAFGTGVVRCSPDEQYEAWEFTTEAGAMVVCMGGGVLAIWSENQPARPHPRWRHRG